MVLRGRVEEFERNMSPKSWKEELEVYYRQRKSIIMLLAGMIVMAGFWTNLWCWAIFFAVLAVYSGLLGVRIGMVCCASFSLWFVAGIERWIVPLTWQNQVAGLWCIFTLGLLVIWKADGVHQLKKLRKGG